MGVVGGDNEDVAEGNRPLSTVTVPKLRNCVPRPLSVPVPPPDASSRVLLALVLAATRPLNTAPGSTTSRPFWVLRKRTV